MTTTTIKLKDLLPPRANPRKGMDPTALEGLAASIKHDGLLHNLVVRKAKGRRYEIVLGERRYRALSLLRERGDIGADFPVPVEVRDKLAEADTLRIRTVENTQREALPPMDEADAFADMVRLGDAIPDIAAKVGASEATVKRRLALAGLCDEAKAAVRGGTVTLAVAEALTLGTPDQQREVLALIAQGVRCSADDVRDQLTDEKPSAAIAIFPRERYTGTVTADLFGEADDTYFDDAEQFHRLQAEAAAELAERHRAAGVEVEVMREPHFPRWQWREAEEDQTGGVVINHAPSGRVEVLENVVRYQRPAFGAASPLPAVPKAKPDYAAPLLRHLAAHKSLAVQVALLRNPRKAREVAVVQMLGACVAGNVRLTAHAALGELTKDADLPAAYGWLDTVTQRLVKALGDAVDHPCRHAWETLMENHATNASLYQAVAVLSDDDLEWLHLLPTVLTFGQDDMTQQTGANSVFNRVARDLDVDMRQFWRPDAFFLSRRNKEQLHQIVVQSGANHAIGKFTTMKKGDLVAALVRYFERTAAMADPDGYDRLGKEWLPEAMTFPMPGETAGADREEPGDDTEAADDAEDETDALAA